MTSILLFFVFCDTSVNLERCIDLYPGNPQDLSAPQMWTVSIHWNVFLLRQDELNKRILQRSKDASIGVQ